MKNTEFYRPRCEILTSVAYTRLVPQLTQCVSYFVHYPPRDFGAGLFEEIALEFVDILFRRFG